jgi:hypothetical protein
MQTLQWKAHFALTRLNNATEAWSWNGHFIIPDWECGRVWFMFHSFNASLESMKWTQRFLLKTWEFGSLVTTSQFQPWPDWLSVRILSMCANMILIQHAVCSSLLFVAAVGNALQNEFLSDHKSGSLICLHKIKWGFPMFSFLLPPFLFLWPRQKARGWHR